MPILSSNVLKVECKQDMNETDYKRTFENKSKTFSLAAKFLPKALRGDITYLYYICRLADDYADESTIGDKDALQKLDELLVSPEIINFFNSKKIPFKYYKDLVNGIKTDISFVGFENFEDLYEYCYSVAGTVGIMCAYLFGITDNNLLKKAESLGVAMQLTNILRDVEEDSKMGRIYFAKADMNEYGVKFLGARW